MTKKTKSEVDSKTTLGETETQKRVDDWSTDQEMNRYYYDDSHGYEVYRDEDEDSLVDDSIAQD